MFQRKPQSTISVFSAQQRPLVSVQVAALPRSSLSRAWRSEVCCLLPSISLNRAFSPSHPEVRAAPSYLGTSLGAIKLLFPKLCPFLKPL